MTGCDDFPDRHTISKQTDRSRSGDVERLDRLLTVVQLAERWQMRPRSIRRMIEEKRIPVIRIGRNVRIHPKVAKLDPKDKV
jgi:excisionase family DNA binding protein